MRCSACVAGDGSSGLSAPPTIYELAASPPAARPLSVPPGVAFQGRVHTVLNRCVRSVEPTISGGTGRGWPAGRQSRQLSISRRSREITRPGEATQAAGDSVPRANGEAVSTAGRRRRPRSATSPGPSSGQGLPSRPLRFISQQTNRQRQTPYSNTAVVAGPTYTVRPLPSPTCSRSRTRNSST